MTYACGPRLRATAHVRLRDVQSAVECLRSSGVPVKLEGVDGGGLVWTKGPGYRSIRLGIPDWPWINDDGTPVAEGNWDAVVMSAGQTFSTTLKAFHGAPPFTVDELATLFNIICAAIDGVKASHMPAAKHLG